MLGILAKWDVSYSQYHVQENSCLQQVALIGALRFQFDHKYALTTHTLLLHECHIYSRYGSIGVSHGYGYRAKSRLVS